MLDETSVLNHLQRRRHLQRMAAEGVDVLVIGGGVTGSGAALDAAARGLRVGLVEQRDYASGTSSRSSKMFHGGLRYLERFEFGLVREALRERNLMLNELCPHLVTPVSFIYPLQHRFWERLYVGAGVLVYEVLARLASNPLPWHRHLGRRRLQSLAPALDAAGGIRYWDALVDDARHTMTVARTAAAHGALIASSTRVVGLTKTPEGRIEAVRVVDLERGVEIAVATRAIVNATGVWTDDVETLAGDHQVDVKASKGVHFLVPRDRIESDTGILLRTEVSVLFVIPWGEHWIVGTTDTPWSLHRAHPAASRSDIEYLLRWVNTAIRDPISTSDIVGVYAGLRPLLQGETEETSRLSREHAVEDRGDGLITVAGGKYTTYRVMASDAVDATSSYLDGIPDSPTAQIPLVGAAPFRDDRLHRRYGRLVDEIEELMAIDPDLARPVVSDAPYLMAEIRYAVTHEGALHLDDVLTRRTRLSIETRHRGLEAARPAAELMGHVLGWDKATIDREIAHYEARVMAEIDSQSQPDDHTADAARMGAPDVRTGSSE
ncbi:MAG TPA: glycerol-3-phosphate dehydrogenase/oxidase [Acidimicrobiia bacterium]